jgi:hypothetical protein
VPFVDTYFKNIFKTRSVYERFRRIRADIKKQVSAEKKALEEQMWRNMRHEVFQPLLRRYREYTVWRNPIVKRACAELARDIRNDIVVCLSTGRIPLNFTPSARTLKRRREFVGFDSKHGFYASGSLIRHLNIYIELAKDAA